MHIYMYHAQQVEKSGYALHTVQLNHVLYTKLNAVHFLHVHTNTSSMQYNITCIRVDRNSNNRFVFILYK